MPFKITLTYSAQRDMLHTAAITALLAAMIYGLARYQPAILRMILLWMFFSTWMSWPLRRSSLQWLYWFSLAGILILLFSVFEGPAQRFMSASFEAVAVQAGARSNTELINDHMYLVQRHLLQPLQEMASVLWPGRIEFHISLVLALVTGAGWRRLRRYFLRCTPNHLFRRAAWVCDYLPHKIARYLWLISLNGLIYLLFWGIGLYLLGFSTPAAPALLMAAASATPFWGPLFAALLSLFFAGDVRHAPFQFIGAAIAFAVTWLASYLLLLQYMPHDRPPLPKGVLLLMMLCGTGLLGYGGFFFGVPLISMVLIAKTPLTPAKP